MKTDFLDAHKRHWEDAESLYGLDRLPNADHLYGFSAECGLKRLMQAFGMPLTDKEPVKPTDTKYKVHVNVLWSHYRTYIQGRNAKNYILPSFNPFYDWQAAQRYCERACFCPGSVDRHRQAARKIASFIEKAKKEGLLK